MERVESSRRWSIYRGAGRDDRFLETFTVRSWSEHMAQHHERYTGIDRGFEDEARALTEQDPVATHAFMQHA